MLPPQMDAFAPYVESLEDLVGQTLQCRSLDPYREAVMAALDGQANTELRKLVPLSLRKASGAFFTAAALAEKALAPFATTLTARSTIIDPACGAGDLLLACARRLPVSPTLSATLTTWGQQLRGFDVHPAFIHAAKARLILLAIARGACIDVLEPSPISQVFPYLKVADGLEQASVVGSMSHVILNPPFSKIPAAVDCTWGSGKVSHAAAFVDRYVESAVPGTRIVAILPDVLRTGSLYAKWRDTIECRTTIESVAVFGAFDAWADVDVFILRCIVGTPTSASPVAWWESAEDTLGKRIGDSFDVHVGPVVPHRHRELGDQHPYLHARLLPPHASFDAGQAPLRRFPGCTFMPPFVAVRRTSAPNDHGRAIGTIVTGEQPVAVENHLLVLTPRDQTYARCEGLLASLTDRRTKAWLDERIRCRHLTVSAVRDLPIWEEQHAR